MVVVVVVEDEIGMEEVGEWMVVSGRSPPTEEEGGGCCWWEEGGTQRKGRKEYVFCVRIEKRKNRK